MEDLSLTSEATVVSWDFGIICSMREMSDLKAAKGEKKCRLTEGGVHHTTPN